MVTVMGTTNMPGLPEKPDGKEAALSTTIAVFGTDDGIDGIGVSHEWNGIVCSLTCKYGIDQGISALHVTPNDVSNLASSTMKGLA